MYRNYVITDLHIPYDILQDKRFTLEEKFLMSIERQYPKILREDIASIMNITIRQVSNHRNSINKKLKEEENFPKREINFLSQEINPPKNEGINRNTRSENRNTPSDSELQDKKNRAYIKAIKFFKGLHTEQEKDENQAQINKIFACKDLFTQEQFDEFDEILSTLL